MIIYLYPHRYTFAVFVCFSMNTGFYSVLFLVAIYWQSDKISAINLKAILNTYLLA